MQSWVATVVLAATACLGDERNPEPAGVCVNDDQKREIRCRKRLAFGQQCKNRKFCAANDLKWRQDVTPSGQTIRIGACRTEDAAKRIGHLCPDRDTFFVYQGGYPMSALEDWDDEWEYYECLTTTTMSNGTSYCAEWSSYEDATDEYELEPSEEQPTYCQRTCYHRRGSYVTSSYECGYTPDSDYEYSSATCHEVRDEGACLAWSQEEWDEHNSVFREYETYTCTQVVANGRYCASWVGDIDSKEEFEHADCQIDDDDSEEIPLSWSCYEAGLAYWYPNCVWFLLPVLASVPGLVLLCFLARDGEVMQICGTRVSGLALAAVGGMLVLFIDLVFLGTIIVFVTPCILASDTCRGRRRQCRVEDETHAGGIFRSRITEQAGPIFRRDVPQPSAPPLSKPNDTTARATFSTPPPIASVVATGEAVVVGYEPATTDNGIAARLRELHALYQDGILTADEFEAQKKNILATTNHGS
ncbi:hypothetical protein CTAYLR_008188 [Chrysophaeum taylorii]|uniref:SHOCT domain-containing protein n=1 Tax=Chrysophaeum taylorii TaxID=2483200 RepID=A0AAD7U989_9STRA|nr:hypothetical protein CTAYLR_008188 [Chrysophaeum taylorii]